MRTTLPHTPPRKIPWLLLILAPMVFWLHRGPSTGDAAPTALGQWEPPRRISTNAANGASEPVLKVAPDGTMIVAYNHELADGRERPFFSRSSDGGVNWSTPTPIYASSEDLQDVALAIAGDGTAHAVWHNGAEIHHSPESDWGSSFYRVVDSGEVVLAPSIGIGADNVLHVVWEQRSPVGQQLRNILHASSDNGGVFWSAPTALATTSQDSSLPKVSVDANNNVHVVWEERIFDLGVPGFFRYEIHYKKGIKSGSAYSWDSDPTVLSDLPPGVTNGRRPTIMTQGNIVNVAFTRQVSNEEQYPYFTRYVPGSGWRNLRSVSQGDSFSVNTNSPFFLLSSLAVCNNAVYYYYHGAETTNAKERVWGATSANSWSTRDVATEDTFRYVNPSLACLDGRLHIVYERISQANVNHQIYYSNRMNRVYLPIMMRR